MPLYCRLDRGAWTDPEPLPEFAKGSSRPLAEMSEDELVAFGWRRWVDSEPPQFDEDQDILTSTRILHVNGYVTWSHSVRDMTDQEASAHTQRLITAKVAEVEALRDEKLELGFSFDFGPPYGIQVLQTREVDLIPWLSTDSAAKTLILSGQPNQPLVMRSRANVNMYVPAQSVVGILIQMQAHLSAIYQASWTHKDYIRSLTDPDEIRSYDITQNWPT